jgi:hypothetical protein
MRVTKKSGGAFVVEDEPMCLKGSAAKQVRVEMEKRDLSGNNEAQKRFLAECEQIFRSAKRA